MTCQDGICLAATTSYWKLALKMETCQNRFVTKICSLGTEVNSFCCWFFFFNWPFSSNMLFSFGFQIVIHALQCTHYVILWQLAKITESSSTKVGPFPDVFVNTHLYLPTCHLLGTVMECIKNQGCLIQKQFFRIHYSSNGMLDV